MTLFIAIIGGLRFATLIYIAVLFIVIKRGNVDNAGWSNICALFFRTLSVNLLVLSLGLFGRIMMYFTISMVIVIPNTIYSITQIQLKRTGKILTVLLTTYSISPL